MISAVTCPTLFHFGNADPYIPNEGVDALNEAIEGHPGFTINVENAGHAFDNHEAAMFHDEAAARSPGPRPWRSSGRTSPSDRRRSRAKVAPGPRRYGGKVSTPGGTGGRR